MVRNPRDLTPDDLAIILLCARLDVLGREDGGARPLKLTEWNLLVGKISRSRFAFPAALLGMCAADLATGLKLELTEAERYAKLLDRGGQLAVELDRLAARGIGVVTRSDHQRYPARLRGKLREVAPPVFFHAGDLALAEPPGLAVVGSRHANPTELQYSTEVAGRAARTGLTLVSGGARGVDKTAMGAAIQAGGRAIGVLADSLERTLVSAETRAAVADGYLLLLTPYHPRAPFLAGSAMGRNKLIYALADFALVVVATDMRSGTMIGAVEALKAKWTKTPVFVRETAEPASWSAALRALGARSFPADLGALDENLLTYMASKAAEAYATADSLFPTGEGGEGVGSGPRSGGERSSAEGSSNCASDHGVGSNEIARLLAFLETPRGEDEIVALLGVGRGLARGVLKELVADGRISRGEKPVRYRRAQPGLWSANT